MARGAAEQIAHAVRLAEDQGAIIKRFELPVRLQNGAGVDIGERIIDIVVDIGGVERRVESKAWAPDKAKDLLLRSLGGKIAKETGEIEDGFNIGGQLQKDLIDGVLSHLDGGDIRPLWRFDDRIDNAKINDYIDEMIEMFKNNPNFQEGFFSRLGIQEFLSREDGFAQARRLFINGDPGQGIESDLKTVLRKIFILELS